MVVIRDLQSPVNLVYLIMKNAFGDNGMSESSLIFRQFKSNVHWLLISGDPRATLFSF